ncbi:MAG TPA: type II toxin-antitoxin system RelE/ParE family toxin [Rhizomicrobium sp.]|nr:type II toxin-antitoxin system RelE/ParE family toxin [Rhizomicrobium sp.]
MIAVRQHPEFKKWLDGLRDKAAQKKIAQRIVRLEAGLFGDVKFFDGIGEFRIDFGPGYRVYFARRGTEIVILLCGGDKSSQRQDINRARKLAEEV